MKKKPYKMRTFEEIKKEWLKDPKTRQAYEDSRFEFSLRCAILDARIKDGLTQKKLAEKIGTKQSAVARFESGRSNPTLSFIKKLTTALGLKIVLKT